MHLSGGRVVIEVVVFPQGCLVVNGERCAVLRIGFAGCCAKGQKTGVHQGPTFCEKSISFESTMHKSKTRLMVYSFAFCGHVLFLTRVLERGVQMVYYASAPVQLVCRLRKLGGWVYDAHDARIGW